MKNSGLTASKLRVALSLLAILTLVGGIVGFFIAQSKLSDYATEVSQKVADSEAGQNSVQTLQQLEQELEARRDIVEKAQSLVAESQSYEYQDQVIQDLTEYASRTGVGISEFNFTQSGTSGTASSGEQTTTAETADTSGIRSVFITVRLVTPTSYESLIRFIRSIENNLTRMQLSSINISNSDNSGNVTVDALNIEVYVQ